MLSTDLVASYVQRVSHTEIGEQQTVSIYKHVCGPCVSIFFSSFLSSLRCLCSLLSVDVSPDRGTAAVTVLHACDAKSSVGSHRRRDLCRSRSPGEPQPRRCRPAGQKSGGRAYGQLPYSHGIISVSYTHLTLPTIPLV